MPVKLIVTDLDDTLLRRDKTISGYTVGVFRRARERGIKVVFATARPVRAVFSFPDLLDRVTFDAMIFHNGAVVHADGRPAANFGIPPDIAQPILRRLHRSNRETAVEINDRLFANFDAGKIWQGIIYTRTDFSDIPDEFADKIIVRATDSEDRERLAADLPPELYAERGLIMSREATKLRAIQFLAERFNVSLAEVAAFGDDLNDVEMLKLCGAGVAMSNAIDGCKAVADCVCGDCDDDGVARWIEENLL
ncbi:MAG: HAD family hydrolase [Oscillospiraceae bacterium]|nr:HAD family hydrolase [Oscillospiraceae bacterium]